MSCFQLVTYRSPPPPFSLFHNDRLDSPQLQIYISLSPPGAESILLCADKPENLFIQIKGIYTPTFKQLCCLRLLELLFDPEPMDYLTVWLLNWESVESCANPKILQYKKCGFWTLFLFPGNAHRTITSSILLNSISKVNVRNSYEGE